jgi:hypothetical protein
MHLYDEVSSVILWIALVQQDTTEVHWYRVKQITLWWGMPASAVLIQHTSDDSTPPRVILWP